MLSLRAIPAKTSGARVVTIEYPIDNGGSALLRSPAFGRSDERTSQTHEGIDLLGTSQEGDRGQTPVDAADAQMFRDGAFVGGGGVEFVA